MDAPTTTTPATPLHDESHPRRFTGRLLVGLAVIAVGVLFLLDAFGVPGIGDVWESFGRFWPGIFVLIGLTKLANAYSGRERVGAAVWILVGGLLIANNMGWLSFSVWRVFWPALIILFGLSLVTRSYGGFGRGGAGRVDTSSRFSAFSMWSGVSRKLSTPDFRGGDASAIMGGCEIDLRQCGLASGPATIDLFALMGGIELYLPGDWTLRNEGIVIMGGVEDSRRETAGDPSKLLILRGTVLMGGIEIKN